MTARARNDRAMKGSGKGAPQTVVSLLEAAIGRGHPFQGPGTDQPGDGERQVGQYLPAGHHRHAAPQVHQMADGVEHVRLIGPHHDEIMGIVGHGGGQGALGQSESLDHSQTQVAGAVMPFHHGQLQEVLGGGRRQPAITDGRGHRGVFP